MLDWTFSENTLCVCWLLRTSSQSVMWISNRSHSLYSHVRQPGFPDCQGEITDQSPICLLVAAFHPHSAVHLSVTDAPAGAGIQRSDLSPLLLSGSVSLRLPGLWIGWDSDWHLFEQMWSPLSECDSLVSEHKCVFKWRRLNVCSFTIGQDWLQTRWCSTSGPQWTHTWTNAH